MVGWKVWLRCVGEAVCANGMQALASAVPFGDAVFQIARDAFERIRRRQVEEEMRESVEGMARAAIEEVKEAADEIARAVAAGQPDAVIQGLTLYLTQVPAAVRQSLRRPTDPDGLSVPVSLSLARSEDLLPLLPPRLPRYRPGEQPPSMADWELTDLLGMGGFGEVWKARHRFFDGIAPVALKFCLDPLARDRLLHHEARVLNQVMRQGRHPGIVPLLDASLATDPPCLKYEFVEGGDLAGLVRDWGTPGPDRFDRATRLLRQLAGIVGFAHRLTPPVVHRDLKPANVLVQRAPDGSYQLRVTDFGIGGLAALPGVDSHTTRGDALATALRGSHTPLYASPQQRRGERPDPRDDIHALGVIWFQLLTGDLGTGKPGGRGWRRRLAAQGAPDALLDLLELSFDDEPSERPADAADLAARMAAVLDAPQSARPEPPAPPPADPVVAEILDKLKSNPFSWLLDLTNRQLDDAVIAGVAASPLLERVSMLILSGNRVGDAGAKALAASPHTRNLTKLVLWNNQVGDEGLTALAASPHLANLESLDVGKNRVSDEGVVAVARSPHLSNLSALILVSNRIGDVGALALADSPYLDHLAELKPLDNHISSVGVAALKARYGKRVRIF